MSKASNRLSSKVSYIHYPRGQTGSGNVHSPTSVRRELNAGSQRENLTSKSPKYACEAFCTQEIAAFSVCRRLNVRTQLLKSKGQRYEQGQSRQIMALYKFLHREVTSQTKKKIIR
jgi:hypothetical protein